MPILPLIGMHALQLFAPVATVDHFFMVRLDSMLVNDGTPRDPESVGVTVPEGAEVAIADTEGPATAHFDRWAADFPAASVCVVVINNRLGPQNNFRRNL